jgi:hypothetical protein
MLSRTNTWRDITDEFEFVDDYLVYVDTPFEGFLEARHGELFAFRCSTIIGDRLIHWVLLPVASTDISVGEVFAAAKDESPEEWISVVEDRRTDEPTLYAARLGRSAYEKLKV